MRRTRTTRQFTGVFCKNIDLLQRSWYTLLIVLAIVTTLMGVMVKLHYFYVAQHKSSFDPNAQIVTGNHDAVPTIALSKDANYNFFYARTLGTDLGTVSYDSSVQTDGYLGYMGMPYPTGKDAKSLRILSDSVWIHGFYRLAMYPFFTDLKDYLDKYDYQRTDIYPGGAADTANTTPVSRSEAMTAQRYRAAASDASDEDDPRVKGLPELIQRLFKHANLTTEAYRKNDMVNKPVRKGFLMRDIPLLSVDLTNQPEKPMSVKGTNSTNTQVTIHSGYNVYGYHRKQTFFINTNDYLRLLNLQYNMFSINIRALINQIYSIPTPSLPGGNIYAPVFAPVISGNYKQFWRNANANDTGPDMYTPMYMCFVLPFCFFIITPLFSYRLSQEKGDGINHLHYMMGLKYLYRWLGDFTYQLLVTSAVAVICVLTSIFGNLNGLKLNTPAAWVPAIVLLVLSIPIFSAFVAAFFETGRNASLVCISIAITVSVASLLYGITSLNLNIIDRSISKWYGFIPVFGPVSILAQLQGLAILQTKTLYLRPSHIVLTRTGDLSPDYVGESVAWSLIFTLVATSVMAVLGMYIDLVMPKRKGIASHWLFFLFPIVHKVDKLRGEHTRHITTKAILKSAIWGIFHPDMLFQKPNRDPKFAAARQSMLEHDSSDDDCEVRNADSCPPDAEDCDGYFDIDSGKHIGRVEVAVDSDVLAERRAAKKGISQYTGFNGKPILIRAIDLTKTYPATRTSPEKQAVRGVSFAVAEGECLGLLGPNGAAKTTTINILTMLHRATTGEAYIDGLDLTDPDMTAAIQNITGICPQFDIQYPTLTCRQHLKYFCRLKRIHRSQEKQHINDLLEAVGLASKANVPSKSLSGGMRRRLSVAIALTGSPRVLYLDEPSTGLDPESKRQLWNVILRVRSDRAILLTTHAMDEAEALCNRIAIMVAGKLKCIGTCAHLQRKFGNGYELVFTVKNDFDFAANYKVDQTQHLLHGLTEDGTPLPESMLVGKISLNTSREVCGHMLVCDYVSSDLRLLRVFSGRLVYQIPAHIPVSQVFMNTDNLIRMKPGVITDWCLSRTNIDDIFFKVVLTL